MMDHFVDLPPNARILELGCGPASTWASQMNRIPAGWQILLIFRRGWLEKRATQWMGKALRVANHDAQAIPFPTGYFDGVIANHMLYHVPDLGKAMAEIRRVLKPGGVLFAATNGLRHMRAGRDPLESAARYGYISGAEFNAELDRRIQPGKRERTHRHRFATVQLALYEDGWKSTKPNRWWIIFFR